MNENIPGFASSRLLLRLRTRQWVLLALLVAKQLERDLPIELLVVREVDLTHAAATEQLEEWAKRAGVDIPHLCYKEGLRPDGNCRACVVEIKGERVLAPSCCRAATAGMEVQACSDRAVKSQKMVVEMLLSDMPDVGYKWNDADAGADCDSGQCGQHGELSEWAERLDIEVRPELKALRREQPAHDVSHPAMAVNLDACIQCTRVPARPAATSR